MGEFAADARGQEARLLVDGSRDRSDRAPGQPASSPSGGSSAPDQVTVLALFFGLAVFPLFAIAERWALAPGGVVFYLAFILDCVDGKLARALGVTSARGAAIDALADGGRRAAGSLGSGLLPVAGRRLWLGLRLSLRRPARRRVRGAGLLLPRDLGSGERRDERSDGRTLGSRPSRNGASSRIPACRTFRPWCSSSAPSPAWSYRLSGWASRW